MPLGLIANLKSPKPIISEPPLSLTKLLNKLSVWVAFLSLRLEYDLMVN